MNVPGAGLYNGAVGLPLVDSVVDVNIVDFTAKVTVTQTFENQSSSAVEAVYLYPVDALAAVSGFNVSIDGKTIEGVINEKKMAVAQYEDAIAEGHGAYLLEEVTGEIFKINVGNMQQGAKATITIAYVTLLTTEGDHLRFSLPTITGTKYPGGSRADHEAGLTSTASAQTQVNIRCQQAHNILRVESPTHSPTLATSISGSQASISMTEHLTKQFVMTITTDTPHTARAWVEPAPALEAESASCPMEPDGEGEKESPTRSCSASETGRVVMASFFPSADTFESDQTLPCELVFVVDRSGSMSGSPINKVKTALQLFLKSIPNENVFFNIVGFGSDYELLFPEGSRLYNDESLKLAQEHVLRMEADLGGTEILRPLMAIFSSTPAPHTPRQVILMTDGEVSNTQEVIEAVAQYSKTTRVFTLGIDTASKYLINGMAQAGHGQAEFISNNERMEGKVMRQLKRAMQRFLVDVNVDWGDLPVKSVAPIRYPYIYLGDRVLAFAFLDPKANELDLSGKVVKFSAMSSAGTVTDEATVSTLSSTGSQLHTLAARELIKELEDAWTRSAQSDEREALQEKITALGLTYKLASQFTAFIAVEKRDEPTLETMKLAAPELSPSTGEGTKVRKQVQRSSGVMSDLLLLDVTPLSLGVAGADKMMKTIIPRNTTIPTRKSTVMVLPVEDGKATLDILEGERAHSAHNNRLDTLQLGGLAGTSTTVTVNMDIDANGIVSVTAENDTAKSSVTIMNDKGRLSKEEIERMIKEAEQYRAEDEQAALVITEANDLETLLYAISQTLTQPNVGADQRIVLEAALNDNIEWLSSARLSHGLQQGDALMRRQHLEELCAQVLGSVPTQVSHATPTPTPSVPRTKSRGRLDALLHQSLMPLATFQSLMRVESTQPQNQAEFSALVNTQRADGSWTLDAVAPVLHIAVHDLKAAPFYVDRLKASEDQDLVSTLWATALAVAWLELFVANTKEEWQMMADKSLRFMQKNLSAAKEKESLGAGNPAQVVQEFIAAADQTIRLQFKEEEKQKLIIAERKRLVSEAVRKLQEDIEALQSSSELLELQEALWPTPTTAAEQQPTTAQPPPRAWATPVWNTTQPPPRTADEVGWHGPRVEEVD